nr:MAG TPA: hypothetical protein [Inoviridae sp.]
MSKIFLQGYCHKFGDFTNPDTGEVIKYDNLILDVSSDLPLQGTDVSEQGGFHVDQIKVKVDQIASIFVPAISSIRDLDAWCGKEIACLYIPQLNKVVLAEIRLCKV